MGQQELEECIDVILQVIKAVNDSLQQGNIRGLPEILYPLGSLVCQVGVAGVGLGPHDPSSAGDVQRPHREEPAVQSHLQISAAGETSSPVRYTTCVLQGNTLSDHLLKPVHYFLM